MAIFIAPVRNALFPISIRPLVGVPPMIILKLGEELLMAGAVIDVKAVNKVPVIVPVPALILPLLDEIAPLVIVPLVILPQLRVFPLF